MSLHYVQVFISHSWRYSQHYETLADWIFGYKYRYGQASVVFRNFSIPADDPVHDVRLDRDLQAAIYRKIARSHVVVIPTGMYTAYSRWIIKELDGADEQLKPILAVTLRGAQRRSLEVVNRANHEVGWTRAGVVDNIWRLYREYY